jgi:hypothetical protein
MEEIREKIERMKIKAEAILNENKKAFLINSNDTYFFCEIVSFNDNKIIVKPFKGNDINIDVEIYWADVIKLEKYKEINEQ